MAPPCRQDLVDRLGGSSTTCCRCNGNIGVACIRVLPMQICFSVLVWCTSTATQAASGCCNYSRSRAGNETSCLVPRGPEGGVKHGMQELQPCNASADAPCTWNMHLNLWSVVLTACMLPSADWICGMSPFRTAARCIEYLQLCKTRLETGVVYKPCALLCCLALLLLPAACDCLW